MSDDKTVREVLFKVITKDKIPQFVAQENGVQVPFFPKMNDADPRTMKTEIVKALKWAGHDINAVDANKERALKSIEAEKAVDEQIALVLAERAKRAA